jgi:1,2-diacylglycerol 3-beta-galactosyltransferase
MDYTDFMFFDAGGGHRAAATALELVLKREPRPWAPRLVHLQDVLAPVDVFRKVLRIDLQEIYNLMLRRGWTLGSELGLRFMQWVIRLYHGGEVDLVEQWWRGGGAPAPRMVVSVVPNFNRAIFDGLRRVSKTAPYVTILTDLADFPPRFWIERGQRQHFICGTERARKQALDLGHAPEFVHLVSGMILHPRFYETEPPDRRAGRAELGLDPELPTGLVLFGGYGSPHMERILEDLDASGHELQLILIAGKNAKAERRLAGRKTRIRKHVIGFTREVPRFMALSDFFIGKPGPGSISEALHMGLPVLTVSNAWTLPQERYNAVWLEENGVGLVLRSYSKVREAVGRLLEGSRLKEMQEAARGHQNRAIYEIPAILDSILERYG